MEQRTDPCFFKSNADGICQHAARGQTLGHIAYRRWDEVRKRFRAVARCAEPVIPTEIYGERERSNGTLAIALKGLEQPS